MPKNGEKSVEEIKTFNVRVPKKLWSFVKKSAVDKDMSMNDIVIKCLEKYRKNIEKRFDER